MSITYSDDYAYADAKLSDSVVLLKGIPVLIHGVGVDTGIVGYQTLGMYGRNSSAPLKEFDLTPITLGNINVEEGYTTYVTRLPTRSWKQGLRASSVYFANRNLARYFSIHRSSFINCVLGKYPRLNSCLEMLFNAEASGIAFSRDFSLLKPNKKGVATLLFKGTEVGFLLPDKNNSRPALQPRFQFLQELLEESVDNVSS